MRIAQQPVVRSLLALATALSLSVPARAQGRTEITINDTGVQAENLTSSQDGTVYFGSMAKGTIYRAALTCWSNVPRPLRCRIGQSEIVNANWQRTNR